MKKTGCLGKVLMALGIVFVILFVWILFSDTDEPASTEETAVEETTKKKEVPDKETAAKEETATEKKIPTEWENALIQAQSYADNLHMSKADIYDQLVSEYGGQFGKKAAQYAIDNVQADWKENAYLSAKSYYENMHMSKADVYDQLVSEYGAKFTPKQARYAVDKLK